jgi:hypothetical protein
LLDRIDAVGRDMYRRGNDASKCAVQEAIPTAKGPDLIIGCPGSYPVK